jgi:hypothetical protein
MGWEARSVEEAAMTCAVEDSRTLDMEASRESKLEGNLESCVG